MTLLPFHLRVRLDMLVPVKQAARELPRVIDRVLAAREPAILTRRGEPVAVLMSVREYETLLAAYEAATATAPER